MLRLLLKDSPQQQLRERKNKKPHADKGQRKMTEIV